MASTYRLNSHSYDGRYMYLSCTQTKNVENNTSTIKWTLTVTGGNSSYYTTGPTTVKINGVTVYYKAKTSYSTQAFPAAKGSVSGSLTVNHDASGDASVAVSIKTNIYTGVLKTTSGTWKLDSNERSAAMLTVPSSFTDEDNPTITYSNPLGAAVPSLQAGISLTGHHDDVLTYYNVDKEAGTDTLELSSSDRTAILSAITDDNSRTVWIYLRTRIGETYFYSPLPTTITIKNPNPTVSPIIKDTNSTTIALTGDSNKLVKYYSNASIAIGASAVKQATIASQKVTCGLKSITSNGTINGVESDQFTFVVTDSRGNTTTKTVSTPFVNYVKLTCSLANNMPDAEGDMNVLVTGNCFNGSFGTKTNSLKVYYRYKITGGSYSSWTAMTVTTSGNTYSATAKVSGLDYQTAYVFQAYAADELDTKESLEKTVKSTPVFDWGAEDFRFNVPVYDEFETKINNGLAAYTGGGDNGIDPDTTLEELCLTSHSNAPQGLGTFYFIYTAFYNAKTVSASRAQIAFPYSKAGPLYHRYYTNGAWSAWSKEHHHDYVTSAGSFRLAEGWMGLYDTLEGAANHTNRKGWIGYDAGTSLQIVDTSVGGGGIELRSPGSIRFKGGNSSNYIAVISDRMRASANDAYYLGDATYRWKAVYAVNGTIQTSDRNLKRNIEELDQKYIDLFDKLLPVSFMFNDSESDRVHIGFISQDVKAAMDEVGLTDLDFAGFCRDVLTEWDEENQNERIVLDDAGEPIYRYSLRYSEFIALNSRMIQLNRKKIAEQETEIKTLHDDVESLKSTVNKLLKELG